MIGSRVVVALSLGLASAAGCSDGSGASCPGSPEVMLGTGVFAFLPMADCGRVPIIRGPQGGYHVWASLRARNLEFDRVSIEFAVKDMAGNLIAYPSDLSNPMKSVTSFTAIAGSPTDAATPDLLSATCPDGAAPLPDGGIEPLPPPVDDGRGAWGEALSERIYMPDAPVDNLGVFPTADVDGRQIRIELRITDSRGRTASDVRTPVPFYRN